MTWVMRPDHAANAVLQGSDDPAAAGVILGVGAGNEAQVEGETNSKAANLDVTFLQ